MTQSLSDSLNTGPCLISSLMTANSFFNLLYQLAILLGVITLGLGFLYIFRSEDEE